jgi:hypothetical protein
MEYTAAVNKTFCQFLRDCTVSLAIWAAKDYATAWQCPGTVATSSAAECCQAQYSSDDHTTTVSQSCTMWLLYLSTNEMLANGDL